MPNRCRLRDREPEWPAVRKRLCGDGAVHEHKREFVLVFACATTLGVQASASARHALPFSPGLRRAPGRIWYSCALFKLTLACLGRIGGNEVGCGRFLFPFAVLHIHFRGKVRLPFGRQLVRPFVVHGADQFFMHLFSRVPSTPYIPGPRIPRTGAPAGELADHPRRSAEHLIELKKIKAAEQNDDAGFNSFFKTGWKRFYLKWYDASHPSAERLCPQTHALLQGSRRSRRRCSPSCRPAPS
jgi:hypothetical protein